MEATDKSPGMGLLFFLGQSQAGIKLEVGNRLQFFTAFRYRGILFTDLVLIHVLRKGIRSWQEATITQGMCEYDKEVIIKSPGMGLLLFRNHLIFNTSSTLVYKLMLILAQFVASGIDGNS